MKTPSTRVAVDRFLAEQDEVLRHWEAQFDLRSHLSREDMNHACTLALTSCARNWEVFRSDWHIRAAASDATVLKRSLGERLQEVARQASESGKKLVDGLEAAGIAVEVHLDKYPTLGTVSSLLDGNDQNVTFRDRKDAERSAQRQLAPRFSRKITNLTNDDWRVVELVTATRNVVAHGSVAAVDRMNEAMRAMSKTASPALRTLVRSKNRVRRSGIGAYLYGYAKTASDQDPNVRVVLLCRHMQDIARRMA